MMHRQNVDALNARSQVKEQVTDGRSNLVLDPPAFVLIDLYPVQLAELDLSDRFNQVGFTGAYRKWDGS